MEGANGNYVADIHDVDYEATLLAQPLDRRTYVASAGRKTESLAGQWRFTPDWYDTCRRAKWYQGVTRADDGRPMPVDWDWDAWETTVVPSCWNLQRSELLYFEGSGVYTRTFHYLAHIAGERAFLRFEGSQYRTSVFLNGKHMGTHDGGSTPFAVEISAAVEEDNRLVVVVEARRRADRVPAENTDWFNYGGLYRDVLLIRTPEAFIADWFIRLVPDGSYSTIALDLEIRGASPDGGSGRLTIPELGVDSLIPLKDGVGSLTVRAAPDLWSPESPKLYEVQLAYSPSGAMGSDFKHQGNQIDYVVDRVGFREIRVSGRDLLLNGEPLFLKGICVHEDHLALGKATDEKTIRSTIAHLKELSGNFLRLAHYPHDGRFARLADELGVLLWEEVPVYWAIRFEDEGTYRDAENQLAELVLRDRNRASVAIWSVGNENADSDERLAFMKGLAETARTLDGTRLVSAACLLDHEKLAIADRLAEVLDVIGVNEYYGWYDPDFQKLPKILENSHPDKPVILCEFGGGARSGHHGSAEDLFSEEMQARLYENQIQAILSCPYIRGTSPWILYDFRSPRRLNPYQEGFNRKGLIAADRETKKLAFQVLARFYRHLLG